MESSNFERLSEQLKRRLVTPARAAAFLGVSLQKLANDRWKNQGCPYIKEGTGKGRVYYDVTDLKKYKKSRLQRIVPNGWDE